MSKTRTKLPPPLRQGDVLLMFTDLTKIPDGCTEIPNDKGRVVLAYGEVTGHAHAISDHRVNIGAGIGAGPSDDDITGRHVEMADSVISRANTHARLQTKARMFQHSTGDQYLEVLETVNLRHEEHSVIPVSKGIYYLPMQVEHTDKAPRQVAD